MNYSIYSKHALEVVAIKREKHSHLRTCTEYEQRTQIVFSINVV